MSLAAPSVAEGADPSLVGWWKLDEGSGTTAYDSSGYGNNGTLVGDPQWVEGKIGGALELDGNGDYVNYGNAAIFDITEQVTLSVWVNTNDTGNGQNNHWLGKGDHTYAMKHFTSNQAQFFIYDGTWYTANLNVDSSFNGEWHHVAGTYDGRQLKLYVDGILQATTDHVGAIETRTNNVTIGENSEEAGRFYDGFIDDVRIYNRALSQAEIQEVMRGDVASSCKPNPEDGATDVPRGVILSWTLGRYAETHDVYFGDNFDDVNAAIMDSHPNVMYVNIDVNSFNPGILAFNTTYYWRVDEVNAPPDSTVYKGETWSFTAEPFVYSIDDIQATASSFKIDAGPENTINGSGLDDRDLHSTRSAAMWLSSSDEQQPTWIKYEFGRVYKLHQMWVWNYNVEFEYLLGFGFKDTTVEYSENGTDWTVLGEFEFAQGPSMNGYIHNTTVDFNDVIAKYVKLTANSNWSGMTQYGLSEVRFFYKPILARQPKPASGQTNVNPDAVLSWRPGREVASHEVYVSSDIEAVTNGTALVDTVNENSFALGSLGLELGKTYYWKVNEVNEAESPRSVEGDVWNFSTIEYLTVDDFEQYDDLCNRIFYAWVDGYGHSGDSACGVAPSGGNGTGSTVGNITAPFAEQTIINEGKQSMPLGYDNSAAPYYSEAQRRWDTAQDWTKGGIRTLTLYFYGNLGNAAEQIYVKLNDSKVIYDGDADDITKLRWIQWNIDLASFGVDLRNVRTLSIGVGSGTADGSGILYIDDIRLYRLAPGIPQPIDPGDDGLLAYYALENDTEDSSGNDRHGTVNGDPTYVQGLSDYGMAMQFGGLSDFVEISDSADITFAISDSYTVATWAYVPEVVGYWGGIVFKGRESGSDAAYYGICIGSDGGTAKWYYGRWPTWGSPIMNTGWYHLAVVQDGTAGTKQLYVNGGLDSRTTAQAADAAGSLLIGASYQTGEFFNGIIDEVMIYNRVLSVSEVLYLAGER